MMVWRLDIDKQKQTGYFSSFTYRALNLLDAKVVLLLLSLSVGDDVQGGQGYGEDQEQRYAGDDEDRQPTN